MYIYIYVLYMIYIHISCTVPSFISPEPSGFQSPVPASRSCTPCSCLIAAEIIYTWLCGIIRSVTSMKIPEKIVVSSVSVSFYTYICILCICICRRVCVCPRIVYIHIVYIIYIVHPYICIYISSVCV